MLEVNWFDKENAHVFDVCGFWTSSWPRKPKKITWIKGGFKDLEIAVLTEGYFKRRFIKKLVAKHKIAWLIESKEIRPKAYRRIKRLNRLFDYVLTHDKDLVDRGENFKQVYVGSSRAEDEDLNVSFNKSHLVSLIASNKTTTTGHKLRHDIAGLNLEVDLWGSGYRRFDSKREPLSEYYYSIAIMNSSYDYYFTEILIDCFIYKCVPIFWGCPSIGDIFNADGIIQFEEASEIPDILKKLSVEDYNSRALAIEENYQIAKEKFMITDDLIADKLIELI